MLSLPESWELPLCKDLKLFLETQQHQEILTHCHWVRTEVTLPDLDDCCFPEGKTKAAMTTITLEHFGVCISSCESYHVPHLLLPESQMLTGAIPTTWEEAEAHSQGHGWPWHPWTAAWCPGDRGWGSGCTAPPQKSRHKHRHHNALQNDKAPVMLTPWNRVPECEGRGVVLAFSRPGSSSYPAHHHAESSREFSWITPPSARAAETPANGRKTPTKSMSKLQRAQLPHSEVPLEMAQCCQLYRCEQQAGSEPSWIPTDS